MRNRYPGLCYVCGKNVAPGYGHFERNAHMMPGGKVARFVVRHINCFPADKKPRPNGE